MCVTNTGDTRSRFKDQTVTNKLDRFSVPGRNECTGCESFVRNKKLLGRLTFYIVRH